MEFRSRKSLIRMYDHMRTAMHEWKKEALELRKKKKELKAEIEDLRQQLEDTEFDRNQYINGKKFWEKEASKLRAELYYKDQQIAKFMEIADNIIESVENN